MPLGKIVFTSERIQERVASLAGEINAAIPDVDPAGSPTGDHAGSTGGDHAGSTGGDHAGSTGGDLHVILTLKGALFFGTDLLRAMAREVSVGFISASSYGGGTESSGKVRLRTRDAGEITGRRILIVEDIIDTGRTLETIVAAIREQNPASVHTVAFIDKPSRREVDFEADFTGFPVEDIFIVGYGLDHAEAWRTLPGIHVFKP